MAKERFIETYSQGISNVRNMTSGCGVAVLVDKGGKPIITSVDGKDSI